MAWGLIGPPDDALRRAGLQRYAEPNKWDELRDLVASNLGRSADDVLTKDDVKRLADAGWPESILKILRAYIGFPIKWIGAKDDDDPSTWDEVPRRLKLAYNLASIVGKNITQKFTEADLNVIAQELNLTRQQVDFLRPFVGKSFNDGINDLAGNIVDTFLNLQIGFPTAPGVANPLDVINRILRFITDPGNWLAIIAILLGGALSVYGGRRWLEGDR